MVERDSNTDVCVCGFVERSTTNVLVFHAPRLPKVNKMNATPCNHFQACLYRTYDFKHAQFGNLCMEHIERCF